MLHSPVSELAILSGGTEAAWILLFQLKLSARIFFDYDCSDNRYSCCISQFINLVSLITLLVVMTSGHSSQVLVTCSCLLTSERFS